MLSFLYLMWEIIVEEIELMVYGRWKIWEIQINAIKMIKFTVLLTLCQKKRLMQSYKAIDIQLITFFIRIFQL